MPTDISGILRSRRSKEQMFSLEPDELTDLAREMLDKVESAPHLCIGRYAFGRQDGLGLEASLVGLEEVPQKTLREELRTGGVCYWEAAPNVKAQADIIRPINILKQESATVETGLRTWPIAHFMAETLVRHPSMIPEGPVLELGSGLGMLGCILRRALDWPHPVVLSECQTEEFPHVLNFLKANGRLNECLDKPLIVEDLFWGESYVKPFKKRLLQAHGVDIDALGGFSCIIGCDLVYHEFAPELLESIDLLLSHSPSAVAYLTHPDRENQSGEKFTSKLESMNFKVRELSFVERCTSWDGRDEGQAPSKTTTGVRRKNAPRGQELYLEQLVWQLGLHLLEIRRIPAASKKRGCR